MNLRCNLFVSGVNQENERKREREREREAKISLCYHSEVWELPTVFLPDRLHNLVHVERL